MEVKFICDPEPPPTPQGTASWPLALSQVPLEPQQEFLSFTGGSPGIGVAEILQSTFLFLPQVCRACRWAVAMFSHCFWRELKNPLEAKDPQLEERYGHLPTRSRLPGKCVLWVTQDHHWLFLSPSLGLPAAFDAGDLPQPSDTSMLGEPKGRRRNLRPQEAHKLQHKW